MTDYLEIDGIHLEYQWIGDPNNAPMPTLVLLHEGLGCIDMWRDFPQRLMQTTGYPIFLYSRHGYGRSDPKPEPWSLRYMHEEGLELLPKVLRAVGLRDVILVGHSDGASISLIYTGGVTQPQVSALILMAPHVFNEELCINSIAQAKSAYENTNLREKLQRYHGDNVDNAFWGWNKAWLAPGFAGWNIEEYLAGIKIPVLLLQGEDDQYGTRKQLEAIQTQVDASVTTSLLPNCRHSPYIDQPDLVLLEVKSFLDQLTFQGSN